MVDAKKPEEADESPPALYGSGLRTAQADPHQGLIATPVKTLQRRRPVTSTATASIRQVAEVMRREGVSSMLLVDGARLVGIVTDRDLRNRVLAAGLNPELAVSTIATADPLTVQSSANAFDALLLMARHNLHHVPVMDGGTVAGMITATDLAEWQNNSAVVLGRDIHAQPDLPGLKAASARVHQLQRNLVAAGTSAFAMGQIITTMTDALTTRLLQLAETRLGPPPVPYAWVAAGSQARGEQTAKSDQDNCLVLDDQFDAALHGPYFEALARQVCTGLDACGYIFCPGEMMAMTDTWRQTARRWREYFRAWINQPDPKALMHTCVFFDLRCVYGSAALLEEVRQPALQATRGNSLFLSHMASNALSRRPPLGLFGRLTTARSGEHAGAIDLKMNGIVPIIDLARVYALAGGYPQVNTHDRLAHSAQAHEVSEQGAHDLRDALEYLARMRIRHQARQLEAGRKADNLLRPSELSNFERTQLKDAFQVVQTLQETLGRRYQVPGF